MYKISTYILFCFFILSSCLKDDVSKISEEYIYNSSISIPVSEIDMGIDDFVASTTFYNFYSINQYALISKYIDFNYSNLVETPDRLEKLLYRIDIQNNFPARLEVEVHFLDANNNKINTKKILEDPIDVSPAVTNTNGNLNKSYSTNVDIVIDENNKDILNQVRKVLLVVYFYDLDENPEVLDKLNNYNVFISVGIRAEINVPTYL